MKDLKEACKTNERKGDDEERKGRKKKKSKKRMIGLRVESSG